MKVGRSGFLMYLFIFACAIVGVGAVLAFMMIISPNITIFGLRYVSNNTSDEIRTINTESLNTMFSSYDEFVINSEYFNVDIRKGNVNSSIVNFVVEHKYNGFTTATENNFAFNIKKEIIGSVNTVTLTITPCEINFFTLVNNSKITLYIPSNLSTANKIFTVNATKGDINFGGEFEKNEEPSALSTKSLNATTVSGDVLIEDKTDASTNIDLTTKTGRIVIEKDQNCSSVAVSSMKGKITLPNISANLNITSNSSVIGLVSLVGNLDLDTEGGFINCGNVSGNVALSRAATYTAVNFDRIGGELSMPDGSSGNIVANSVVGNCYVKTTKGNVYIDSIQGAAIIETRSGNINVAVDEDNTNSISITTYNGRVDAYFNTVVGNNLITSEKGTVNVYFKTGLGFTLTCTTSYKINLLWIPQYSKDTTIVKTFNSDTTNTITINSTQGTINADYID